MFPYSQINGCHNIFQAHSPKIFYQLQSLAIFLTFFLSQYESNSERVLLIIVSHYKTVYLNWFNKNSGWILLTYNLIRYQMVELCFNLKENYLPYQLSFNSTLVHGSTLLVRFHGMAESLICEGRRG